jgi:autotransporter-associated beta strand protein
VAVAGGVLALGGNSDTVGSFAISGGSLTGSGTVTAANYTLGGGTVAANLGSGAVNVTGNASLNGTSNGTTLNLTSGTLTLGSAGRLAATTAVAVTGSAGGALALGGSETIGSLAGAANVALGSSALTVGGNNQSTTYSGGLSGSGLFTKVGSGTLTLTGVNSNSGGTTVSAGRLVGTTSSLQSTITNNAAVTFDQATSGTYSGAMTGSGSLTKIGDGVVTLSGNNSTSGGVAINAGSLALGSANALGSTGTISFGGGALQYSASNTTDYSGRFSTASSQQYRIDTNGQSVTLGSDLTSVGGTLTKIGSGTLTLTGTNSYDGGTTVSGGRLVAVGPFSIQTAVLNNAELEFVSTVGNYNFDKGISGSGALIKSGAGGLFLVGTSSYSGGTVINEGTLIGDTSSLQGAIANGGVVSIGMDGAGTFAGAISGTGALEVLGGDITFTGTSTYTGATTVFGGSLAVNGALGNTAVTVQGGGRLGGSGAVGGSVLVDGVGILSPGNSIASLAVGATTFTGTSEFVAASTFEYEVDSTNLGALGTAADLLVVNGGLNLDLNDSTILTFTDLASTPQAFVDDTTIFALINYAGAWNGGLFTYSGSVLADGDRFTVGSQEWEIDYNRTSSAGLDNFTGDYLPSGSFVAITAVPEPSTWAMALAGLACGGYVVRRRRKRD